VSHQRRVLLKLLPERSAEERAATSCSEAMQLIILGAFRPCSLKSQDAGMGHAMYALYCLDRFTSLALWQFGHHESARSCSSLKLSIGAIMFGLTFLFRISLPTVVPLAKMDLMLLLCLKLLCQIVMHFDLSSGKQKYAPVMKRMFQKKSSLSLYFLCFFVLLLFYIICYLFL
jgi:hypothetical protein